MTEPTVIQNKKDFGSILSGFSAIIRFLRQGRAPFHRPIDGSGYVSMDDELNNRETVLVFPASIEADPRKLIGPPALVEPTEITLAPDADRDKSSDVEGPKLPAIVATSMQPYESGRPFMNTLSNVVSETIRTLRERLFHLRLSAPLILLVVLGSLTILRGQPVAPAPDTTIVNQVSRDDAAQDEKPTTDSQSRAATSAIEGVKSVEAMPVQAVSIRAGIPEQKAGLLQAGEPVKQPKVEKVGKEGAKRDRDGGQRSDVMTRSERTEHQKLTRITAITPGERSQLLDRPTGGVDYRSWKSNGADVTPPWIGPPPAIYGRPPVAAAPVVAEPIYVEKKQDRLPSAKPGILERVVDAPGAVLSGGKQALYDILDAVW